MKLLSIIISIAIISTPVLAEAHPGRTDANGGHVCRTNCEKWGVAKNQWHKHNDGTNLKATKVAKTKSKTTPKSSKRK